MDKIVLKPNTFLLVLNGVIFLDNNNKTNDRNVTLENVSGPLNITNHSEHDMLLGYFVVTWYIFAVSLIAIFVNSLFVFVYFRNPRLQTPFSVYLLNLAFSDLGFACFDMSGTFMSRYFGHWPLPYGSCGLWLYSQLLFPAAQVNSVFLIALDRLIAVWKPVFYRNRSSTRYSVTMIIVEWIWLNIYVVPGFINVKVFNKNPKTQLMACHFEYGTQAGWALSMNVFLYVLPQIFLVIFYALIAGKMKTRFNRVNREGADLHNCGPVDATATTAGKNSESTNNQLVNVISAVELASLSHHDQKYQAAPLTKTKLVRDYLERRAFVLLTALTISVTVCWFPGDIYYFIIGITPSYYTPQFDSITKCLSYSVAVLNPLFYHAFNRDIRQSLKDTFLPAA